MMGYSVLGFAFGLLAVSFGYGWYIAIFMSIFIYAGALQFAGIGFLNAKIGYIDIAVASLFINIRQAFYGLSVLKKFKNTGRFKAPLIFALTDETYALLTSMPEEEGLSKKHYYLFLGLLNQSYWVGGTILGALFGKAVDFDTRGLEFSLTALFAVLAIEQYKKIRNLTPFVIGSVISILALFSVSKENMLIVSIFGALILMALFRGRFADGK